MSPTPPAIGLPVPSSWYCLGLSADLPPGAVWRRTLAGRELVVFRTASGRAALLDAYCPHLGADLGVGGRVEGETLRCPFHGFCFDVDGACASTPYGRKVPPAARSRAWPLVERNGLVFAWYGTAGESPAFEIAETDTEGWTAWREHVFDLRGHPQEIAENSVDIGHFAAVHGYEDVVEREPLRAEGAFLHACYGFARPRGFSGKGRLQAEIRIHQQGLGYAQVEVEVRNLGLRTRQLVLPMPVGPERVLLRIAMAVDKRLRPKDIHPLLFWLPGGWLAERIANKGIVSYAEDVAQDLPIWQHKVHLPRPALADGDGPVGAYRKWVRQFYPVAQAGESLGSVLAAGGG